ncbi:MAG: peptidase C69 [Promethearchaeota archaeon]|nr:MAG: peptidase C69 [Candidatus Lokiarchaeota archaeon]
MCDTFVSLGSASKDNSVIFGKNSDRLSNEAQLITYVPKNKYIKGEEVHCTHISIPQVSETAAILMSQPYWMFGCEMGCNEYGVAIGNEAIATKEPLNETGLLGMDLLRLGLERGKTAKDALKIIIDLLEKYGQGGAHNKKGLNYHNSMIITDPNEAYVLETAGEWWIVEIVKDYRSISNNISILGKGDMRKEGIIQHAIEQDYCKDDDDFNFKINFSPSPLPEIFPINSRDGCSLNQLAQNKGNITPKMMMNFLREHEVGICMHGRSERSVGSQVSHLRKDKSSIHWFTGNSIPCLGIFKPYIFPVKGQKVIEPGPYIEIKPEWFWSRHDNYIKPLVKKPNKDIPERNAYYEKLRTIEDNLLNQVNNLIQREESLSDKEFINKIADINKDGWQKSEELIK